MTVELEELQTKEFEVQVTPTGTPKEGYKAGAPVLRPTNRVHVTLPASEMDRVDHVGGSISIEGADKTLKDKSVKLVAYDGSGQEIPGAEVDPAVLEVEVPITNPFKQVPIQLKLIGQLPSGLSVENLTPSAEQATIYGPQTELDKIDFIEADLNLSEVTKSGKVDITLNKSDAITEVSPAAITVDVQVVLTQTRTIQGLPITIKGLGNGLKMQIMNPASGQADITFKGAPAVLDKLQPGDVSVEADLSGRGPGTYTIPLNVNSPRFVDQSGATPRSKSRSRTSARNRRLRLACRRRTKRPRAASSSRTAASRRGRRQRGRAGPSARRHQARLRRRHHRHHYRHRHRRRMALRQHRLNEQQSSGRTNWGRRGQEEHGEVFRNGRRSGRSQLGAHRRACL